MANIKEEIIVEIPPLFFWCGIQGLDDFVLDSKDGILGYMDREGYRFKFKIRKDD